MARKDGVKRMILREEDGAKGLYHLCFENILLAFDVYSILFCKFVDVLIVVAVGERSTTQP